VGGRPLNYALDARENAAVGLLLDLLALAPNSWRFWLSTLVGLAIGRLIQGSFVGVWPIVLAVCGIFVGLVWMSSNKPR
jgi:hypothetical protein